MIAGPALTPADLPDQHVIVDDHGLIVDTLGGSEPLYELSQCVGRSLRHCPHQTLVEALTRLRSGDSPSLVYFDKGTFVELRQWRQRNGHQVVSVRRLAGDRVFDKPRDSPGADILWEWDFRRNQIQLCRLDGPNREPSPAVNLTPSDWFARLHPDDLQSMREALVTRAQASGASFDLEYRIQLDGHGYRRVLCRVLPRQIDGFVVGFGGMELVLNPIGVSGAPRPVHATDALTGLLTRTGFIRALTQSMSRGQDHYRDLLLCVIDVERFAAINNSLGPTMGDRLLIGVANRLRGQLAEGLVGRIGDDEFAITLRCDGSMERVFSVIDALQRTLAATYRVDEREFHLRVKCGVARACPVVNSAESLLNNAMIALSEARGCEEKSVVVYSDQLYRRAVEKHRVEADLHRALTNGEFLLHYQPIIDLNSGVTVGLEALIRWNHPLRGMVSPGEFIDIAEESGLGAAIGDWVIDEACAQIARWRLLATIESEFYVSVNLSGKQLQPTLLPYIQRVLRRHQVEPSRLRIEITENSVMNNPRVAAEVLNDLRAMGLVICLDDFGTGYSSLSYLHQFPIDVIKIDRSFIPMIDEDLRCSEIVSTIVTLGNRLQRVVVAEGVETEQQLANLSSLDCRFAQGYLFSRPLPAEGVLGFVKNPAPYRWAE